MDHLGGQPEETFFEDASMFHGSRDGQTQNWLRRKDHAWVPFGDGSVVSPLDMSPQTSDFIPHGPNPGTFLDYRSAGIRSECETIPGDSGYGSILDSASNYDDSFNIAPVQNLDHDLTDFKISLHSNDHFYGAGESHGGYLNPSSASEQRYLCSGCNQTVKTKSELKKHELRHTKPFRCENVDCARKDRGFASQNDLTRHQMTVHGNHGLGKTYYCNLEGCARKGKPWPRADNFRSHLQRVHKLKLSADADLSQYLNQSRDSYPIAEDLQGIGTRLQETPNGSVAQDSDPNYSPQDPMRDFPDIQTQPAPHHVRVASQVSIKGLLPPSSQPAYSPSTVLESEMAEYQFNNGVSRIQASCGTPNQLQVPRSLPKQESTSSGSNAPSLRQDDVQDMDAETDDSSGSDENSDVKDVQNLPPMKESSAENQPALMELLRTLPKHVLKQAWLNAPDFGAKLDQSPGSASRGSQCDRCDKTFNRPCELRKHMKRHDRPYGCTVPRCTKKFGSKNDWKRHERGQHSQTEVWTCDFPRCPYFSYQKEWFDTHLRSHHGITDAKKIDEKLENNRRGGHCVNDFWCGFCKELVSIDTTKTEVIDQRFDHIDDHFMGRGDSPKKDMTSWCHPETFFEKALHPHYIEQGKKRKQVQQHTNPRPKKQLNMMST